jgi:hypothetical protein
MVLKPYQHGQEVPVVSFNNALDRIKGDLSSVVPQQLIDGVCAELRLVHRKRLLTPMVTTVLALTRAMHAAPMSALRHLSGRDVSAQAYSQAVTRLPVEFFARLQRAVGQGCRAIGPSRRRSVWNGRRLFLIDGTSFSMPDTPELQAAFGQPGGQTPGCGFPVAHLLIAFDAATGLAARTIPAPMRTHDIAHAALTHDALGAGDVLVGDRAFASFAHLALLRQRGLHGVFRAHQRRSTSIHRDRFVTYPKPKQKPVWMTDEEYTALPDQLLLREVQVRIRTPSCRVKRIVLVTTLLDAVQFPAAMIAPMFAVRWQAETNIAHLKQTLQLDVLRSRTAEGVLKELHCIVIIYNLVRQVMLAAARRQRVDPQRISFIDAWRWLRQANTNDPLPELIVNPDRPNRVQPRVRKRRPKQYPLMQQPRHDLIRQLLLKRKAA